MPLFQLPPSSSPKAKNNTSKPFSYLFSAAKSHITANWQWWALGTGCAVAAITAYKYHHQPKKTLITDQQAKTLDFNRAVYRHNVNLWLEQFHPYLTTQIKTFFGTESSLLEEVLKQLEWSQAFKKFTPQADTLKDPNGPNTKWSAHLNREVFRALVRISWRLQLQQLDLNNSQQTQEAYTRFIANQPDDNQLSKNSFITMCRRFQRLTRKQVEGIIRATVIASVPLTPEAKRQAALHLEEKHPHDSVQFSNLTVSKALTTMYPIASEDKAVNQTILACFPSDITVHWRHAVLLESFTSTKALIAFAQQAKRPTLLDFLDYWETNALGMNGHVDMTGAQYCSDSFIARSQIVRELLVTLNQGKQINFLQEYAKRALQLANITPSSQPGFNEFIVGLLSAIDAFHGDQAEQIVKLLQTDTDKWQALIDLSNENFQHKSATYVPGIMQNLVTLSNGDIEILLKGYEWIQKAIADSEQQNVSFFAFKSTQWEQLISNNFTSTPKYLENGMIEAGATEKVKTPTSLLINMSNGGN